MFINDGTDGETEIPLDAQTLVAIDDNERQIRRSTVAFLMWHSGHVFTLDTETDSVMRANLIDDNAKKASKRLEEMEYSVNKKRTGYISSIRKQVDDSDFPNIPICNIDVELLESKLILPKTQPPDTTMSLPTEISSTGIVFENYEQFKKAYNEFSNHIVTSPKSVLFWLQRFERPFLNVADPRIEQRSKYHKIKPEWIFVNPPKYTHRDFQALSKATDVGRLVKTIGQVIEKGEVKTILTHIAFRCVDTNEFGVSCGYICLIDQDVERGTMTKPGECTVCSGKKWMRLESQESRNEAIQRLTLQEEMIGTDTRKIMIELRGNNCEKIEAGSTIEVVGTMRLQPMEKTGLICSQYISASHVIETSEKAGKIDLTSKDIAEIELFKESMDLEDKMNAVISSWAGHIHGHDDIKAAIVLMAIGADEEKIFGLKSNPHVLIIGDPGTAKTKLLELSGLLQQGNRYIDATNTTQAGLTAACVTVPDMYTNQKYWVLSPGEIPLTPEGGICAVDEFNLYKGDYGDVRTAMASEMIIVSKVIKGRLPAKCSILAGANPSGKHAKRKKFNQQLPYLDQIDLDFPTMQRFAAVYKIVDKANFEADQQIANAILKGRSETVETEINLDEDKLSIEFIQKLIQSSKGVKTKLSKRVTEYLSETHARIRSEAEDEESLRSHRQVDAIAQFTIAAAKFDGVKTATLKHVRFAERMLENTLEESDPGAIHGGLEKGERELRGKFAEEFVALVQQGFMLDDHTFDEIYSEMKTNWDEIPSMDRLEPILKSFARDKQTTNIIRSKSGNYTYNGTLNPAWRVW